MAETKKKASTKKPAARRSSGGKKKKGARKTPVVRWVDGIHAVATANSAMDNNLVNAGKETFNAVLDRGGSLEGALDHLGYGVTTVIEKPGEAAKRGLKTALVIGGVRFGGKVINDLTGMYPATVKIGRKRHQIR